MHKSFLLRLWHGEVPLVITFWVFWLLLSNLIFLPWIAIGARLEQQNHDAYWLPLFDLLGAAIAVLYVVFFAVSVWRSASNYQSLHIHSLRSVWGGVAKAHVVLTVIWLTYVTFTAMTEEMVAGNPAGSPSGSRSVSLTEQIHQFNSELPVMIADNIRWDSIAEEDGQLVENYTLINARFSEIETAVFVTDMRPFTVRVACDPDGLAAQNPHLERYVARYRDRMGRLAAEISVRLSECR